MDCRCVTCYQHAEMCVYEIGQIMSYRYVDGMLIAEPKSYCPEHMPGLHASGYKRLHNAADAEHAISGWQNFCPYCGAGEDNGTDATGRDRESDGGRCACMPGASR